MCVCVCVCVSVYVAFCANVCAWLSIFFIKKCFNKCGDAIQGLRTGDVCGFQLSGAGAASGVCRIEGKYFSEARGDWRFCVSILEPITRPGLPVRRVGTEMRIHAK